VGPEHAGFDRVVRLDADALAELMLAAESCPTGAIEVRDGTGAVLWSGFGL
jgi:hypothetical protein